MLVIIAFVIVFTVFMFCAACSFGRSPSSGKTTITRPTDKSVDGFGGARGHDYSYSPGIRGAKHPFPVGLRVERKKTDTHDAYSKDDTD